MAMAMTQPLSSPSSFSFSSRRPPSGLAATPPRLASATPSSWSPTSRRRRALTAAASLHLGPAEIAELAHNKALIAATVACSVGQVVKLFTSGKNGGGGRGVDIKAAVRSGGMPSTHSAAVVAVTTSLALERGFADSIFGMSMVFAAIVMYDAQGVRREVGKHAGVLNKLLTLREKKVQNSEEDSLVNSTPELISVSDKAASSFQSNVITTSRHSSGTKPLRLSAQRSLQPEVSESTELNRAYEGKHTQLSESVGHTGLQVAAGALLGFVVSLAVYTL